MTMGRKPLPVERRFWSKVRRTDGCWLWVGATTRGSTGGPIPRLFFGKQARAATRVSWELHFGPIPEGLKVCHRCPGGINHLCVRPDHLFLARASEGNQRRGEERPNARLTAAQVLDIRRRYEGGARVKALAEEYGVSRPCISHVVTDRNWRHVDDLSPS